MAGELVRIKLVWESASALLVDEAGQSRELLDPPRPKGHPSEEGICLGSEGFKQSGTPNCNTWSSFFPWSSS